MNPLGQIAALLSGQRGSDRIVPPSGFTARLTLFAAGAMAFLAVFALALSLAAGRLADRWSDALAGTATIRVSAPEDQMETQVAAVLAVLRQTPGVASAERVSEDAARALLAPWLGPDLPLEALAVPTLIELREGGEGFDPEGLRLRLAAEAPGAVLDDHARWRRPLVEAAGRLRLVGYAAIGLIAATTAAIVALAAQAALAANRRVAETLRLIGASDLFIARAFVRRFTLRALAGAAAGAALATLAIALLPRVEGAGSYLTGLAFVGAGWLWPLAIPCFAAIVAFWTTRIAAFRMLRTLP